MPKQAPELLRYALELAMTYVPRVLLAILVLIIGLWLIKKIVNLVESALSNGDVDVTLTRFLRSLTSVLLKAVLFISIASMVGVETTSFVALLGAAGLAIGLALQGSLANFAGGVLILIFKPFRVGQFIDAQGVSGTVAEIQIFNTVLNTPDNKRVIVPNGPLSNGIITNVSAESTRRVDFVFGIGYEDDIKQAKATIADLVQADERIFRDPAPKIVVSELADSSVNITVRVWANAADYWDIYFELTERVKTTFDERGISIPYPQTDVHLQQAAS